MRREALNAMIEATEHFVYLPELHQIVGRKLAELTRNDAAVVTNGGQAGLVLAVAATFAHDDHGLVRQVSDRPIEKNEVLVHRSQYTHYLANTRQVGARIVEYGLPYYSTGTVDLESAITSRTAAIVHTAGREFERLSPTLEQVIGVAQSSRIPVIVDAAVQVPPVENFWRYTQQGADLVVFCGGKGIRGPQDTGLVVGKKALVDLMHQMISPHLAIGRAMKSSKEDIVGLYVAVEALLLEDHQASYDQLETRARRIGEHLAKVRGVKTWVAPRTRQGQPLPITVVELEPESKWTSQDLIEALRSGRPSIELGACEGVDNAIAISPLSLSDDEGIAVVERIIQLLNSFESAPSVRD
jgi:L-seryl-tRNA(Ser) seleniumtransferase